LDAVALIGDYTHFPEAITRELNHYGRAGVPLVLVYSRSSAPAPLVLPALLTPEIVINALNGQLTATSWPILPLAGLGALIVLAGGFLYWRRKN